MNHCLATVVTVFGAPQTSPSRISVLAVFPSPREAAQEVFESLRPTVVTVFGAPQAPPSRRSVLAVFPSPREAAQEVFESYGRHGGDSFLSRFLEKMQDVSANLLGFGRKRRMSQLIC